MRSSSGFTARARAMGRTLLHAARKLMGVMSFKTGQPHHFNQFRCPLIAHAGRDTPLFQTVGNVFFDAPPRKRANS